MDIERLWKYGESLPNVHSRAPFGPETLSLEIGQKMFVLMDLSGEHNFYNAKVDEAHGEYLCERYSSVKPGWHMNKRKWVSVDFSGELGDDDHFRLVRHAYREVLKSMSQKKRRELTELNIRPAKEEDLPAMLDVFTKAKAYMREQGNPEQWMGDYPGREDLLLDIKHGWSYVIEHCGDIVATFCMMTAPEAMYAGLPNVGQYFTLHRVASDGSLVGIVDVIVEYALRHTKKVRLDTHPSNQAMLKAIKRLRMKNIGNIVLDDNTPRIVFESGD